MKEYENSLSQVSIIEEKNNIIRLELKPVITAFSDCMVLSFSDKDQTDSKISWYNLILNIIGILQDFAYKMLCHGFLVRGAITSGKLFHERGVVLGPALIEAYELESKRAIIPRILITDEIIRKFNDGSGRFLDEKKMFFNMSISMLPPFKFVRYLENINRS